MSGGALTESRLRAATDDRRFVRGEDYVRYVHGVQLDGDRARGSIQVRRVYNVRLDWSRPGLRGECSCQDNLDGYFCKHLVALGLAVVDSGEPSAAGSEHALDLAGLLDGLATDDLRDLLVMAAGLDLRVERLVRARAAAGGRPEAIDVPALTGLVRGALRSRGLVDYRRSFDVAADAQAVPDDLERLLDAGAGAALVEPLKLATTRLRTVTLQADDSAGVIGDAGQRAVDLYGRACSAGHPKPVTLARWLVKFRRESPGWPNTPLSTFVRAFDDRALAAYRKGVAEWSAATAGTRERFEVQLALVELADHDHDLDAAIALLSDDVERTYYGDIVARLVAADRVAEAVAWVDRAVEAGRIELHVAGPPSFRVVPEDAVSLYLAADRPDEAISVMRWVFRHRPEVGVAQALFGVADRLDRVAAERRWVEETLTSLAADPYRRGSALVTFLLAEHRADEAWRAARTYGPGSAWESLADTADADHAAEAAELFRLPIEQILERADSKHYASAAKLLQRMRAVAQRGGSEPTALVDAFVGELRGRYARRPSLISTLDRHGLR